MPPNQRKIAAPDDSLPYELFITNRTDSDCQKSREVKNSTYLNVGILSHVKGSAYIEFGNTKVLSAVLAPREISKQNKKNALGFINCILKCARTGCKNLDAAAITKKEKSLCVAIRKALEPAVCILEFNNFQIDIIVYVLQDDGCVLSSAINCIGAALVDGGVPLYDLITATTVLINNDEISFNPTAQDEYICMQGLSKGHSMTVIATLASQGQIAECFQIGYIPFDLFKKIFTEISEEKKKMLSIVKKVIRKRLEESLKTKA